MHDQRLRAIGRPADSEDIESSGVVQQTVLLQEVQRQLRQPALLGIID
jgi:hypothetical protein